MKLRLSILILVFVLAATGFSQRKNQQGFRLTLFGGLGVTNFGGDSDAGTGMIGGVYGGFSVIPLLELGFQINATITPYNAQFPIEEGVFIEENITQYILGAYSRFYFFNYRKTRAYVMAGSGFYFGTYELLATEPENKAFKPTLGFNIGAGVLFDDDFMIELQYHFVNRELNVADPVTLTGDNFQASLGYQFTFK